MKLLEVCKKLDSELRKESLTLHENVNEYAVPPESSYNNYDEIFREYNIFGDKIFTVMIRKNKIDTTSWVRCGYKENPSSMYVDGISDRDCTTDSLDEIINHCKKQFNAILDYKGW